MTMRHIEPIVCECGHKGTLNWSENDSPFSKQWERYRVSGFDGGEYETTLSSFEDALAYIKPKCPKCGAVGKVRVVD